MNTHTPRAQQHRQVQSLAVLAMFTAILFLLTFTPIGMIDLPIIKATVLHVPVIIGALLPVSYTHLTLPTICSV